MTSWTWYTPFGSKTALPEEEEEEAAVPVETRPSTRRFWTPTDPWPSKTTSCR